MGHECFVGTAVCLGWAGVRLISKGRLKKTVAAPVVLCGCCVLGLAPAHTAAVWLSVWAAGITGRPFTPALSAAPLPQRSFTLCSLLSFLFLSFTWVTLPISLPCSLHARLLSANLPVCVSVSPSPPLFIHFLSLLFLPIDSHRDTNINSSSYGLLCPSVDGF